MADFGEEGRDSTMRALDGVGIRHSGREGDVASWEVRGRRVALIAFAPNVGAHQLNDAAQARARIAELAERHDIVIVSMHAGAEGPGAEDLPFAREIFHGEDRGDVVAFARAAVDAGADLVLGHGPHIVRPLELYQNRLIAYSLGNFATYYGISVAEMRGLAPILHVRVGDDGEFLGGRIEATIQIRPGGPVFDPERRVLELIRELTSEAFPDSHLVIAEDGTLAPQKR
jgi:poly-gamma-glutamate capsule biosynthesis protein CapA/YwtB (metallophosphatase superfamily)